MSILYKNDEGWFISHEQFITKLYNTISEQNNLDLFYKHFFHINQPFNRDNQNICNDDESNNCLLISKKRKRKKTFIEEDELHCKIRLFISKVKNETKIFSQISNKNDNNLCARLASNKFYNKTIKKKICFGENKNSTLYISNQYIFPPLCKFYCDDIDNLNKLNNEKYDLILMDPPWTNKYIKRKKKKIYDEGYSMILDTDLEKLPIGQILAPDGLISVWCTNSQNHINSLINNFFPAWDVSYVATWYWIKVTVNGEYVCKFTQPPGKQPYERIIFGRKRNINSVIKNPEDNKFIVSIPSSVHSHKPPLTDVLSSFLPETPNCLELFARYLLPNWTSFGLETLKFQHLFLYQQSILTDVQCLQIKENLL
ncbi:N(6)-adenine-specific methyltransferase METTL4 [Daktulosphaira vitifoliae]|uniref:N(6)-adenine-specific methyltransferase METTL4 n=1 Tax=Daktulosphaira vitifoliae TaxID=58002 RepID=UPI0021AA8C03|nr:N(6)-adenine-specific methyltransferase METTL4 [Daktulosphaira vitifoliae]